MKPNVPAPTPTASEEAPSPRHPASAPTLAWVVAGIVVLALSLRAPIIAPTAVIGDIKADTGLSAVGAGLLTGVPVLLFALATPLATRTIRRFGPEVAAVLCLAGVLAGTVIRSAGPAAVVLAGTVIIGAAITLGNIAVPVLIRRDISPRRVAAVTGVYTAVMNVGSMAVLLGTPPLADLLGWRWAIAAWGIVTAAGLAWWLPRARRRAAGTLATEQADAESPLPADRRPTAGAPAAGGPGTGGPRTDGPGATARTDTARIRRITVLLALAFSGQSAAYYATTAWLPLLLSETRGLGPAESGATASLFQVFAIIGALGVPLLAARTKIWVPTALVGLFWVVLPIGLLAAPEAYALWSAAGGIAQGGGFTAVFSIVAMVMRSNAETASASARIQVSAYLTATCAPPAAGWLNTATGGWTAPLLLVLGATLAYSVGALLAARMAERS
ncbi:MFS transporter [Arthrobacter ginkgonis]|uniref:MFS transporter n=1 Tax=Arthrobacter ginkgonis TaxID=1630594 RepID=UPI0031EE06AB